MIRSQFLLACAATVTALRVGAVTITIGGGVPTTSQGIALGEVSPFTGQPGVITEGFNGASGCGVTQVTFTGKALFGVTSVARRRLAPSGDQSCYMAVGTTSPTASETLSITVPQGKRIDYIGFYLGSYDEYNFISFGNGTGATIPLGQPNNELGGTALAAMTGAPPIYSSIYLGFGFSVSEVVRSVIFRQTNFATELDNFTYRLVDVFAPALTNSVAVPIVPTLAMFVPALGLAAIARARRARTHR